MQQYHLQNRRDREITNVDEITELLLKGKYAIISLCRDNEPYIVTLSYGFDQATNSLYFHCSRSGLKMDFLQANKRVCATVLEDNGYINSDCSHNYRSVVLWGDLEVVTDPDEKKHGMTVLLHQLESDAAYIQEKLLKAEGYDSRMEVLRLKIVQLHAKARK